MENRRRVFAVTEKATSEALPVEKMVDTLCEMEEVLGSINNVMVAMHEDIKKLVETAQAGTAKSDEAMTESGWVKLHLKESVEAVKELTEELRRANGVPDNQ